jgi:nitroreductase
VSDLFETMATMRAMRRLAPEAVPAEVLSRLVEAATWAPSGGNLQQHHYVVVTERETLARLAPIWRRAVDLYLDQVSVVPGHVDAEAFARMRDAIRFQAERFEEIPALIAACCAERRARPSVRGVVRALGVGGTLRAWRSRRRAVWLTEAASVYPGVENLLLAARTLGLGACMTLWHLPLEREVAAVLRLPPHVRAFALIPVGRPLGRFGPVRRRPVDEVLHWERFELPQ